MAIGFALVWGLHFASIKMDMSRQRRAQATELASRTLERFRFSTNWGVSCPGFTETFYTCASTVTTPVSYSWQRVATVTISWNEKQKNVVSGTKTDITVPNSVTMSAIYIQ
jgi:hypothetical protein